VRSGKQGLTSAELLTAAQLPIYLPTRHSQCLRARTRVQAVLERKAAGVRRAGDQVYRLEPGTGTPLSAVRARPLRARRRRPATGCSTRARP